MKKISFFLSVGIILSVFSTAAFSQLSDSLSALLSPNVPIESIPKDLKLPDKVIPFLKTEFDNTIGKQGSFDVQFKIVLMATMVTNIPSQKFDFLNDVVMFEVRNAIQTAQKTTAISPDARVLAINAISASSNSNYVSTMLAVVERDDSVKPRIAAAKVLPALGNNDLIVPKLLDLVKNQYGGSRAKFDENDQKRYDDDRVAQAIIETLGDLGDPRSFAVLLQTVMNPDMHRDDTIKAGWDAIKKLKW
jgi:hypothetical protein